MDGDAIAADAAEVADAEAAEAATEAVVANSLMPKMCFLPFL